MDMPVAPPSPFAVRDAAPLDPAKFRDPLLTAKGDKRAWVGMERLETLWINTGTLCNLACRSCYIESSPTNDALVYLSLAEAEAYFDEAAALGTRVIGFTGGERWRRDGWIGRSARNLTCLGLYRLGVPPERIARLYA